jgi:hypothetical protein
MSPSLGRQVRRQVACGEATITPKVSPSAIMNPCTRFPQSPLILPYQIEISGHCNAVGFRF